MQMLLERDELWCTISEEKPEPVTPAWSLKDSRTRATIGLCVDDNQVSLVRNAATAKDAWKELKEYHRTGSEVYLLRPRGHGAFSS